MDCISEPVVRVADKSFGAREQVERAQRYLRTDTDRLRKEFLRKIDAHLAAANVTDARELSSDIRTKTEYLSETSDARVAQVIRSSLTTVMRLKDPWVRTPSMDDDAISTWTDAVNMVAEAAKSTSASVSDETFLMARLAPGLYAFVMASSIRVQDPEMFGAEAIATTMVFSRFMESIQDVQKEAGHGAGTVDSGTLARVELLRAALVEELADGGIDVEEWTCRGQVYSAVTDRIQARLKKTAQGSAGPAPAGLQAAVSHALGKLSRM